MLQGVYIHTCNNYFAAVFMAF